MKIANLAIAALFSFGHAQDVLDEPSSDGVYLEVPPMNECEKNIYDQSMP